MWWGFLLLLALALAFVKLAHSPSGSLRCRWDSKSSPVHLCSSWSSRRGRGDDGGEALAQKGAVYAEVRIEDVGHRRCPGPRFFHGSRSFAEPHVPPDPKREPGATSRPTGAGAPSASTRTG